MKRRKTIYDYGRIYHNGKFKGWASWKVHTNCTCERCPDTVAEFFGKHSQKHAKEFTAKLNQATIA